MVTPTGAAAVVLFGWSETPTHGVLNSLPFSVTLLPTGPIRMGANSLINDQRLGDGGLRTVTLPELPAGSGIVATRKKRTVEAFGFADVPII